MLKKVAIAILWILSFFWKIIPFRIRKHIFFTSLIIESRGFSEKSSLKRLFALEDYLSLVINERALAFGKGEHPKHALMQYHNFFIDNLNGFNRIVDLGCGYGAVARSVAAAYPNSIIYGIDNNNERLSQARTKKNLNNLQFELVDIIDFIVDQPFDAVILSNVLEHISNRVEFLQMIINKFGPKRILIRIPDFERHWSIPLRKQLKINYFSDPDHKIEHTLKEFENETSLAGLKIEHVTRNWGEIWAICSRNL